MNKWNDLKGRKAIVRAVFAHLRDKPGDIPRILNPDTARDFVAEVGETEIPADVRVFCLPKGDRLKDGDGSERQKGLGGSLILEIPPDDVPIPPDGVPIDKPEFLTYSCTYSVW